ncbi:MAG: extracellular solute-binding protein, partial [Clostridia bacterium]|nr:extracellular solute-binding protein [Clostridia bacterium]
MGKQERNGGGKMNKTKKYVTIAAVLLCICAAVYLNWSYNNSTVGSTEYSDAELANAKAAEETGAQSYLDEVISDYFAEARLTRQQSRDEALNLLEAAASSETASQETIDGAMNAIAAGNQPALVQLECATGVSSMYANGALVDLDAYIAASALDEKDFVDILMYHSKRDGKLVAIPYMRSCAVYYYNKTLFDELGLQAPSTIAELEQVGSAVTAAKPDVYGFEMSCMSGGQWVFNNM